jgi:hypothetical protein
VTPARTSARSWLSRGAPCVSSIAILGASAEARADDAEPIRILYEAPAACPDASQFADEITARTRRARIASAGEQGRTFAVKIRGTAGKATGRLTLTEAGGRKAQRDVAGGTCEEVVSAIGLIAALAIDPQASTAAHPAPPPLPPPPPPPRPRYPPPARIAPLPWWGPIGAPLPVIPARESTEATHWRPTWGLAVGGMSALAPQIVLTTSGFVAIERVGGGVLSPSLRLAIVEADSGFRPTSAGHQARYALLGGRIEGCPVRLRAAAWLSAYPCVRLDAGQVTASGFATVSLSTTRPWAAPGVGARARAEIASRLDVEAEAGALFPLVRDTFGFGPPGSGPDLRTVPPVGGFLGLGVGTHLP